MEQFEHQEPLPEEIEEVVLLADTAFEHIKAASYFEVARQQVEEQDPAYKEIFEAGSTAAWARAQLNGGVATETIVEFINKFFLDVFTVVTMHESPEGSGGDYVDETDGWLPPPEWRG